MTRRHNRRPLSRRGRTPQPQQRNGDANDISETMSTTTQTTDTPGRPTAASDAAHEHAINFGALAPMPPGYQVIWSPGLEHYLWINDKDQEGLISWDRYWCRRCAFAHHAAQAA